MNWKTRPCETLVIQLPSFRNEFLALLRLFFASSPLCLSFFLSLFSFILNMIKDDVMESPLYSENHI